MLKNSKKIIVAISMLLSSYSVFSADQLTFGISKNSLTSDPAVKILQNLNQSYDFKNVKVVSLPNGVSRYKLEQYYLDVPVMDSLIVSNKAHLHNVKSDDYLSGSFIVNIEHDISSVRPGISKIQAMSYARQAANIRNIKEIKNPEINLFLKLYNKNIVKLVYLINFFTDTNEPSRPYFVVDANTGEVLEQWEGLTTSNYINGSGAGGNEKTGKYIYGEDYRPLIIDQVGSNCLLDSPNVVTYDLNHKRFGEKLHKFPCSENNYKEINGAYAPINDAHYFGNVVYDMYKEWYKSKPLNFKLKMRVHYGNNYQNAFWDGRQMTFGDGAKRFYPLISLDVVSHEVSHGFTEQNSDLIYRGQSGGINEAFSDMAGETAEYYMNMHKPEGERIDWLVGGSITKEEEGLRYFEDPTKDGKSIGHADDYYSGLNVHYSSGVYNKAFYLLSNTNNWDIRKAFETFVLANQLYWGRYTDFDEGACGVYKAASDLEYSTEDIVNAFKEVGVNALCEDSSDDGDNELVASQGINLENSVPYRNITGYSHSAKLFYIDVKDVSNANLTIWNYAGVGVPTMLVSYKNLPNNDNVICKTDGLDSVRSCNILAKQGRYYIKLDTDSFYSNISLYASY